MPEGLFKNLDEESKSRLLQMISEAKAKGIPADRIQEFLDGNAELIRQHRNRETIFAAAEKRSDPMDTIANVALGFLEPTVENLIALPLSFFTGPGAGKLAAGALGSRAVKNLAVRFVGDPAGRTVVFNAARKAGLTEAFNSLVRIKAEPSFLVALSRALGFSLPFAAADAVEAIDDDQSPLGAFGSSLGVFTSIDLLLTRALPGVGHKIAQAMRKRVSEEYFAQTTFGESVLRAEEFVHANLKAHGLISRLGMPIAAEMERASRILEQIARERTSNLPVAVQETALRRLSSIKGRREALAPLDPAALRAIQVNLPEMYQRIITSSPDDPVVQHIRSLARAGVAAKDLVNDLLKLEIGPPVFHRRLNPEVQESLRNKLASDIEAIRSVAPELTPDERASIEALSNDEISALTDFLDRSYTTEGGLMDFADSVRRAHNTIKRDSPQAATAIEQSLDQGIAEGLIGDSPAEQVIISAIKDQPVIVPPVAAGVSSIPTRVAASKIEAAAEGTLPTATLATEIEALATRELVPIDLELAKRGDAVLVSRPDGQLVEATIDNIALGQARVKLPSGAKEMVPEENIFPRASSPELPSIEQIAPISRGAVARADASGFEQSLVIKLAKELEPRQSAFYDPRIRANFSPKTRAQFPGESLVGQEVEAVSRIPLTRTRGVVEPGEKLIIGREGIGLWRAPSGKTALRYKAFVYRIDDESGLPHFVNMVTDLKFDKSKLKQTGRIFRGSEDETANAIATINARTQEIASSLNVNERAKLFAGGRTIENEAAAQAIVDAFDQVNVKDFPFFPHSIVDRSRFLREARVLKATGGLKLGKNVKRIANAEDISDVEGFVTKAFDQEIPTAADAAILAQDLFDLRRLSEVEKGLTAGSKALLADLRKSRNLTSAQRARKLQLEHVERGLTNVEQKRLLELKEKLGTVDDLDNALQDDIETRISDILVSNPVAPAGQSIPLEALPDVTSVLEAPTSASPSGFAAVQNAWDKLSKAKIGKVEHIWDANHPIGDFIDAVTDFVSARGMRLDIRWNPDIIDAKAADTLFSEFVLEFEGRPFQTFAPSELDSLVEFLGKFDPKDPNMIDKIRAVAAQIGRKPSGGC